jgi:hypothetical protein
MTRSMNARVLAIGLALESVVPKLPAPRLDQAVYS